MNKIEITEQANEIEHWKFVAAYLASCHAATLEGLPESAPKSARRRFSCICENAAAYLRGKSSPPWVGMQSKADQIEWDIKRCENAVLKYRPESL